MVSVQLRTLPKIAVLADRYQQGVRTIADVKNAALCSIHDFEETFFEEYDTDAHFVCYSAYEEGKLVPSWPRVNKDFLPLAREAGTAIKSTLIVLEYDNPEHKKWIELYPEPSAGHQQLNRLLESISNKPFLKDWTLCYTTRSGLRLVYALDEPIEPEEAEAATQYMVQCSKDTLLVMDEAASDWTRLFRLPQVMRDGEKQSVQSWFKMEMETDRVLNHAELIKQIPERIKKETLSIITAEYDKPRPDIDDCVSYITAGGQPTEFYRKAKKRLRGRECFNWLFEYGVSPEKGSRNYTMSRYIGQVCSMLANEEDAIPERIYALFQPRIMEFEEDESQNWEDIIWSMVCRFWAREQAKESALKEKEEVKSKTDREIILDILEGMDEWCTDPMFSDKKREGESDADVIERRLNYLERRAIISCKASYYVMGLNGFFDSIPVSREHIIPRLRELRLESLIPTIKYSEDGLPKDIPSTVIVNKNVKVVSRIEGVPEVKGGYLDGDIAKICLYRRNPYLTPKYDADVDEWLHILFGKNYDYVAKWIGHALAWEEGPICAFSLIGAPGSGKKMFAEGLSETLESPLLAGAEDLVGRNQYGIAQSPFLMINEGWPKDTTGRPIDRFRQVVGGDTIQIQRKFQDTVFAKNPLRLLMFANNTNVVDGLIGGQNMSIEDRQAVGIRILHVKVTDEASRWLHKKGGVKFTGTRGRMWITSDSGVRGDFIVARHFLWLWQNRPPRDNRLLVEGNGVEELMLEMSSQSGHSPVVYRALVGMIESFSPNDLTWGKGFIKTEKGEVFTCPSAIFDYYDEELKGAWSSSVRGLSIKSVSQVLESMESSGTKLNRKAFYIDGYRDKGRKIWTQVGLRPLLEVAQRYGWDCPELSRIVEESSESISITD